MGITQFKGDIALSQAIASFTKAEFNVSLPITESAPYDLIVEKDSRLYRVQSKYCGDKYFDLDLRCIHSNSKGYVIKKYDNGFDWLYVLRKDGEEFLFFENFDGRRSIRINKEVDKFINKI